MSNINILIKGEEAEAFAQKLLEIEGISRQESDREVVYKGKKEERIINLTASMITIGQLIANVSEPNWEKVKNLYNYYHNQQKIEVIIQKEDKTLCEFHEFFSLSNREPLDSFNQGLPSGSLPSLQEIAKLPIPERHKLLSPFINDMAEDFNNDPELTIFSVLDGECLE